MRRVRYRFAEEDRFGQIKDNVIEELDGSYLAGNPLPTGKRIPLDDARLLCPTLPTKVICVGLNYRDHAEEMGVSLPDEPCLFMKPETSVIGPDDEIVHPAMTQRMDYEAELGIVIGQPLHHADTETVRHGILGYTCVNDVTARDLQTRDGQWTRAKGFDTFCPIGPWIVDEVNPDRLDISLHLNGDIRQQSNTRQFVCSALELVGFISRIMTLRPGDVVATGTPAGIGPMRPGDQVEVRIEGIGSLRNTVVSDGEPT